MYFVFVKCIYYVQLLSLYVLESAAIPVCYVYGILCVFVFQLSDAMSLKKHLLQVIVRILQYRMLLTGNPATGIDDGFLKKIYNHHLPTCCSEPMSFGTLKGGVLVKKNSLVSEFFKESHEFVKCVKIHFLTIL